MKDRILSLLGGGISPSLVSSAVGCTESYISQLLSEPSFALEVATLRCKDLEAAKELDTRYDTLEEKLLKRLEDLLPFMLRPREVLHALQVVNNAKRRASELLTGQPLQHITNNIVLLQLPTKTVNSFELSKNNEILSVEGKALIPMSTDRLMKELSSTFSSPSQKEEVPQNANQDNVKTFAATPRERSLPQKVSERLLSADAV